jgi:hypothetical protein
MYKHIQRFLDNELYDLVSLDMEITTSLEYLLLSDTIEDKGTIFGDPTIKNFQTQMENQALKRDAICRKASRIFF